MIEVIDNFIPLHKQNIIYKIVNSDGFDWVWTNTINYDLMNEKDRWYKPNKKQFVHHLIVNGESVSDYSAFIIKNLNLEKYNILRAKINLNLPSGKKQVITPHIDVINDEFESMIYYINDSDGDTIIYNDRTYCNYKPKFWWKKTRITPKKGRIVKFPSNILHSGNIPNRYDCRMVINVIYNPN